MSGSCYYHPSEAAVDTCVNCGMPICADCRDQISGRSVCHKCVGTMRARLEQEMAAEPGGLPSGISASPFRTPAETYPQAVGALRQVSSQDAPDAGRLAAGVLVALLIGILGCIATEKVLFYAHFGLSYLYILVGYGIGWGLHKMTGRSDIRQALTAVGVMVLSLVVSHLVYAQDILTETRSGPDGNPSATFGDAFNSVITHSGFMHWIIILIGLYACYRGEMRRS